MSRTEAIKARLDEYETLMGLLTDNTERIAPNGTTMVYLGDGYFTEMTIGKAQEFVQSRINTLKAQYQGVLYDEGVNEEGLPIMDICEELDEDGNVVNSTVERTGGSIDQIKKALTGIRQEHESSKHSQASKESPNSPATITEVSSEQHAPTRQQAQVSEDMEVESIDPEVNEITDKITESNTQANETPGEGTSNSFHGISRDDMLELELLGDELEEMQVKMNEDEQLDDFDEDYEMEYDEDASEESDEDEFGRSRGSLFPSDPRTAALLEKHLASKKKSSSGKSVSFSPSLEVKEFETTSAERKGQVIDPESEQPQLPVRHSPAVDPPSQEPSEARPKMSLFKQRMGGTARPGNFTHARKTERPTTSDIIENLNAAKACSTNSPVVEKVADSKKQPMATNSSSSNTTSSKPSQSKPKFVGKPIKLPTTETQVPAEFIQYVNDPDEVDMKDLEPDALQYFDEATIPDEDFLALHDHEEVEEPRTREIVNDEDDNDSPVSANIIERMPEHKEVDENDTDMSEIKNEYQRLRQKLVYKAGGYKKTDKDQAAQEVDEDGNPVKVSRFRAARMGLR